MSDASNEVLLDDFEDTGKWELAGAGAAQTHLTTFAEGAPVKDPGVYADGEAGEDARALALLIKNAADGLEVDLAAKPGQPFSIAGTLAELNLFVRSPHAAIWVFARFAGAGDETREELLSRSNASPEWQRAGVKLHPPIADAELLGLRIRLVEVVKTAGEVMILLDDLTVRSES
ncbi:hypothetical protein [Nocardia sp. NPDC057668]|uniref:hypothetical protein n=1 Tax=Nocardia sp. NPDC057668 TaxID=3346202 RepID=UPI00366C0196